MTIMQIYSEAGKPEGPAMRDHTEIAKALGDIGVEFELWEANQPLAADADAEAVMTTYQASIEQLDKRYGFQSKDVVALRPDNPQKADFRQKFLAEHTHADFEVRFFVDGSGLFYLHIGDKVYLLLRFVTGIPTLEK